MPDFMEFKMTLAAGENPPWRSFMLAQTRNFMDLHGPIRGITVAIWVSTSMPRIG